MFHVAHTIEDREPNTNRLLGVRVAVTIESGGKKLWTTLSQEEALAAAVRLVGAVGGSVNQFETAWRKAEAEGVARQRAASVPPKA